MFEIYYWRLASQALKSTSVSGRDLHVKFSMMEKRMQVMNCGLLFSLEENDGKRRLCGYNKILAVKLGIENFQMYMAGLGFH